MRAKKGRRRQKRTFFPHFLRLPGCLNKAIGSLRYHDRFFLCVYRIALCKRSIQLFATEHSAAFHVVESRRSRCKNCTTVPPTLPPEDRSGTALFPLRRSRRPGAELFPLIGYWRSGAFPGIPQKRVGFGHESCRCRRRCHRKGGGGSGGNDSGNGLIRRFSTRRQKKRKGLAFESSSRGSIRMREEEEVGLFLESSLLFQFAWISIRPPPPPLLFYPKRAFSCFGEKYN